MGTFESSKNTTSMKLAFYYHVPYVYKNNQLYIASYLGVFIDALAEQVSELTLLIHVDPTEDMHFSDYAIQATNIRIINLGEKKSALRRTLFGRFGLKKLLKELASCDVLLVRGPSPLADKFRKVVSLKIAYLIVGDYAACATEIQRKSLKEKALATYFNYVNGRLLKALINSLIVVNSSELFATYQSITPHLHLLKTSTLVDSDYHLRTDFSLQNPIQVVYTGRIEATKGLFELVASIAELNAAGTDVHLKIVGWEIDPLKPVEKELLALAEQQGIASRIEFTGKKKIGAELNGMYRGADIFIIPSYHEGFPRVIWEAMANSTPVIATNVGGIPHFLHDREDVLLIAPKSSSAITTALKELISNDELRKKIALNGFELAQENKVATQAAKLIEIISRHD
jgi:glycosyltransferase involved in cell wall biosynthesis